MSNVTMFKNINGTYTVAKINPITENFSDIAIFDQYREAVICFIENGGNVVELDRIS